MLEPFVFAWDVINSWSALVTGGWIIASLSFWSVWRDKPVRRNVLVGLSVLFLLASFYRTWEDQREKVRNTENEKVSLQQKYDDLSKPLLKGEIEQVVAGTSKHNGAPAVVVFVLVSIKNSGAPSIAQGWVLDIEFEGVKMSDQPTAGPNPIKVHVDGKESVLAPMIYEQTLQPISRGGITRGWLRYFFKPFDYTKSRTRYTLHFSDVLEHPQECSHVSTGRNGPPMYYPGASQVLR